jgi:hypothetical protein
MRNTYSTHVYIRAAWLLPVLIFAAGLSVLGGSGHTQAAGKTDQPAACPGARFSDVCPGDWFYTYVMELADLDAISGYADGTFRPNNGLTRGQVVKVIVIAMGLEGTLPAVQTFRDVPPTHPFFPWVEIGALNGVAGGYDCGGPNEPCPGYYFRPGNNVSRGQLAKMICLAVGWVPLTPTTPTFRDVASTNAFYGYVERVASLDVIGGYNCGASSEPCPGRYFRVGGGSTRAQASKMVSLARGLRNTATPTPTGTRPTSTPTYSRTATRTATRTNTPAPTNTPGGPCPLFPSDNIWNRNISALPTHALSAVFISNIGLTAPLHPDFGSGLWDGGPIGIPYVTVPGSQPRVPVSFYYPNESDPGPYPVPTNAPIEGGPNATGDRHVLVIDRDACVLYELYDAHPHADGSWDAGSGARWPLTSNTLRPDTWTSADAAGLPIMAGLVNYDEMATGVIRHALRFTAPRTQGNYVWPARHRAGSNDATLPPMGLRVRLKASVNISGFPTQARVVLQAMKDYGLILADNGTAWHVTGIPDERWDNDLLNDIESLHGSDFEAVDESGLMVDPNSGQSR